MKKNLYEFDVEVHSRAIATVEASSEEEAKWKLLNMAEDVEISEDIDMEFDQGADITIVKSFGPKKGGKD